MAVEPRALMPPPGRPVKSYNQPQHFESTFVERISIAEANYTKLPYGTLYKDVPGADSKLVAEHPNLLLQNEIVDARFFPTAFRYWGENDVELSGQEYEDTFGVPIPYKLKTIESGTEIGDDLKEITPVDRDRSTRRTLDIAAFEAVLANYLLSFPGTTNIELPNRLLGITSFCENQDGAGDEHETAGTAQFVNGSFTVSPRSQAQASVVAMPDVTPTIQEGFGVHRLVTHYLFFLKAPVTKQQVVDKLTALIAAASATVVVISEATPGIVTWIAHGLIEDDTVFFTTNGTLPTPLTPDTIYYVRNPTTDSFNISLTPGGALIDTSGPQSGEHTGQKQSVLVTWPTFKPRTETIFCVGGRASVLAKASAQFHQGGNLCGDCTHFEESLSSGNGASREIGVTIKAVRIPATVHDAIDIVGFHSSSFSIDAQADADAYVISDSRTAEARINAYITPISLPATDGAQDFPTSGIVIVNVDAAPYRYRWVRFHCEVVDAAEL